MLITIIEKGRYSNSFGKRMTCVVGEEIEYPPHYEWYARSLIDSGFAVEGKIDSSQMVSFESLDDLVSSFDDDNTEDDTIVDEINATTAALVLAEEKGIDLTTIKGTGRDGRITKTDVENAAG